ncbi:MAG: helix-turn-helix domain-containing protein, partial [Actinomycetota bacterium]
WHSCTVLREHRGDAHWRATAAHGVDPVECHILHAADGAMPEDLLQRVSGWDDDAWAEARYRLEQRGLITSADDRPSLTADGRTTKRAIEAATDSHADRAIDSVGATKVLEFREQMRPWITAIMDADVIGAWKMREALWRDE